MKRGAPSICATAVIKEKRMLAAEVSVSKHNRIRIRYTRCDTFLQFELDASVCTVVLALFDLAGFFFFHHIVSGCKTERSRLATSLFELLQAARFRII